jgi:hypothetical protein
MKMLEYSTYEEAREKFAWNQTWELFDGTPENFNLGHECVDRHIGIGTATRINKIVVGKKYGEIVGVHIIGLRAT